MVKVAVLGSGQSGAMTETAADDAARSVISATSDFYGKWYLDKDENIMEVVAVSGTRGN